MSKTAGLLVILMGGLLLLAIAVVAEEEGPWFDMENCGFCKNLMTDPNLMPNMTWEHHMITNGMISVTTVKPEYMESFNNAMKGMEEVAAKMQKGEQVPMCNYCKAYGELMMAGVVIDYVMTQHGSVVIMTSDKPEVVEKIKKYGQRTIDEYNKMMATEAHGEHH